MTTIKGTLCWNAPIWFLLTSFWISILYIFIDRYFFAKHKMFKIIIPVIALMILFIIKFNLPLELDTIPVAFLFYYLGVEAHNYGVCEILNRNKFYMPIFFIIDIIASQVNQRISVHNSDYGNLIICLFAGLSGIAAYYIIIQIIQHFDGLNMILCTLGKNSMFLMCLQYFVFQMFSILSNHLISVDIWHMRSTLKALILSAITLSILMTVASLSHKYLPKRLNMLIGIK